MKRTPEPDLMNDPLQALAYANADFTVPHEAFCDEATRVFDRQETGRILDLGCGPADVTIRFARRFPIYTILGVDGAEEMLKIGRQSLNQANLEQRVQLELHYLPSATLPTAFDGIISNSLLHHLDDPMVMWQTISNHARAGAPIFVMDLMRPESKQQVDELVQAYARDEPEVLRKDFEHSLHAAYRPAEVEMQLSRAGLGHLQVTRTSDRHLIVFGYR
ncbi:MAG: class I SAM-dependent methyltransferase [Bradymonadia bacterium]